jgi:Uma2 family endonuclease
MTMVEKYSTLETDDSGETPDGMHALLQIRFLNIFEKFAVEGIETWLPVTFRGIAELFTPDISLYPYIPKENLSDVLGDATAPLLAIEIISPGQTIGDMVKKCEGMIASGVEECWIVEPANESITVCTKERRFVRHEGEVLTNRFLREPLKVEAIFHEEIQ